MTINLVNFGVLCVQITATPATCWQLKKVVHVLHFFLKQTKAICGCVEASWCWPIGLHEAVKTNGADPGANVAQRRPIPKKRHKDVAPQFQGISELDSPKPRHARQFQQWFKLMDLLHSVLLLSLWDAYKVTAGYLIQQLMASSTFRQTEISTVQPGSKGCPFMFQDVMDVFHISFQYAWGVHHFFFV